MELLRGLFRPKRDPEEERERQRMQRALAVADRLSSKADTDAARILEEVRGVNGFLEKHRGERAGSL